MDEASEQPEASFVYVPHSDVDDGTQIQPVAVHFLRAMTLTVATRSRPGKLCNNQRSRSHICLPSTLNMFRRETNGSRKIRSARTSNPRVTTDTSSRVIGCS